MVGAVEADKLVMPSSKKHTPEQPAILEASELRGLLAKTSGPEIQQSKEAYIAAWLEMQANPHERKLAAAATKALRLLAGKLEDRMIMGTRAKRLLYQHWEKEALKQTAPNAQTELGAACETGDVQGREGSWVRAYSSRSAQLRLQEVMIGWGK
jgi:hypothetical protein